MLELVPGIWIFQNLLWGQSPSRGQPEVSILAVPGVLRKQMNDLDWKFREEGAGVAVRWPLSDSTGISLSTSICSFTFYLVKITRKLGMMVAYP